MEKAVVGSWSRGHGGGIESVSRDLPCSSTYKVHRSDNSIVDQVGLWEMAERA